MAHQVGNEQGFPEGPLEQEMATHSSILAWKTPWTEEPGGLQSMGYQSQIQVSTKAQGNEYAGVYLHNGIAYNILKLTLCATYMKMH